MTRKKVLIVDDSAFMRKMISNIVHTSKYLEVVATARDGKDALEKLKKYKPDVITLDVEMPLMDGLSTLKEVMDQQPTPVIMLSSVTKAGADKTIEAMALGAIDFITKPSGSISLDIETIKEEITTKVELAANVNIAQVQQKPKKSQNISYKPLKSGNPLVTVGSSTGGPRALQELLTHLPSNFQAPIVIVQHMPKGFTKSLADRLNKLSAIDVKEVVNGDEIKKGIAYIAEGGKHFTVIENDNKWIAKVWDGQPVRGHQPSVDTLFSSVASLTNCHPIAVVLTGMGSDGTEGVIQLKRQHPRTIIISQSKETCIVYGMPQAAVKTSLVDYVEDLDNISTILSQKIQQKG